MSKIQTNIWLEQPEENNPFAASRAYCHGYDIQELMQKISWEEMVYLLFLGELPSKKSLKLLKAISVLLANPGIRSPMVHAAMCGGVGGSVHASSLMAALAVGAGQQGGAKEVSLVMSDIEGCDSNQWCQRVQNRTKVDSTWPELEHTPGFDVNANQTSTHVLKMLELFKNHKHISWLNKNRGDLEVFAGNPLSIIAVTAAAFLDIGLNPDQGEMLYLILSLPGCAAHALEQAGHGFKKFPFPELDLRDDPRGNT